MQAFVVGTHVCHEGFKGHGAGDFRLFQKPFGFVHLDGGHARDKIAAVDGGQTVPGLQAGSLDTRQIQGFFGGHTFALVKRFAFAHQRKGALAHGGKIAAGPHAALGAHHRSDALVEHIDIGLGNHRAAAGVTVAVNADAAEHGGPHMLDGSGFADACGMVVYQVLLELLDLIVVEFDAGQLADAGVDAVHNLAFVDFLFQKSPAPGYTRKGFRGKLYGFAPYRHVVHIFYSQIVSGNDNGHLQPP